MNLTPEQFARLEQLFTEAVNLSPSRRLDLLTRVRQEAGPAMADRLEALLAAHSEETKPMSRPFQGVLAPAMRSAFEKGDLILDRFRIVRLLGRGGMGEVYEAEDSEIGRVALKTIRLDIRGERALLRFKQEVQLARMVTSPYVCRIHELFTLPADGRRPPIAFLTMEFLEGMTLADRITEERRLAWRDAESIALQLCQGLEAMHSAGIIHRDLKSRNMMLATHRGATRAVVMDLGLAHRLELDHTSGRDRTPLTLVGTIMGTPDYMAPEQFESAEASAATDIYSFGVMLYEMVTGRLPFEASTPMGAAVRRAKRPPPASSIQHDLPHRWDATISRCLEYEPAQRFQSAIELATALRGRSASTVSLLAQIADRPSRRRIGLVLASVALVAAAITGSRWYRLSIAHKVPEAAQAFYREAADSFHIGNYLTATRQLQEALKLDSDFALAHARLADAFIELDSSGEAQREVNQIKEEFVSQLSSSERTYVQAVRETVRPDANAAVKSYENQLSSSRLPTERANALVDLGRADERAGKIDDATTCYGEAARLNPYAPTPFLRRGILESRQGKQKQADADFALADKIYSTNINLEGTAEVDYQRSYVASKLGPGHEAEARRFFLESLDAAKKMRSVALQIRALSRLSAIEYGAAHDEEAGKVANDAIRLANDNGVAYWATDARLRLGNSWIYRDEKQAERILEGARQEALRNQWPRLLALGQLSLATHAVQQQTRARQQQTIDLTSPASDYYRIFGYAQESIQCEILLSRAKSFFGLFAESLNHARRALEVSKSLASSNELLQAEEAVGSTLFSEENYPAALEHLTSAFHIAEAMPAELVRAHYLSVEALLRAETLCRLGRVKEAQSAIAAVPRAPWKNDSQAKLGFARFQAELLKSQGKYKEMLKIVQNALHEGADNTGQKSDFQLMAAEGLTRTGNGKRALSLCDEMLKRGGEESPVVAAQTKLAKAHALLESRQWHPARTLVQEACQFFRASGMKESELIGLWLLGRSYWETGAELEARAAATRMQELLASLKQQYGAENYRSFVARSDMAETVSDRSREVTEQSNSTKGMQRKIQ